MIHCQNHKTLKYLSHEYSSQVLKKAEEQYDYDGEKNGSYRKEPNQTSRDETYRFQDEKYTGWEKNILHTEQENVSTLGDIIVETIQQQTKNAKKNTISELWNNSEWSSTCVSATGVKTRERVTEKTFKEIMIEFFLRVGRLFLTQSLRKTSPEQGPSGPLHLSCSTFQAPPAAFPAPGVCLGRQQEASQTGPGTGLDEALLLE